MGVTMYCSTSGRFAVLGAIAVLLFACGRKERQEKHFLTESTFTPGNHTLEKKLLRIETEDGTSRPGLALQMPDMLTIQAMMRDRCLPILLPKTEIEKGETVRVHSPALDAPLSWTVIDSMDSSSGVTLIAVNGWTGELHGTREINKDLELTIYCVKNPKFWGFGFISREDFCETLGIAPDNADPAIQTLLEDIDRFGEKLYPDLATQPDTVAKPDGQ